MNKRKQIIRTPARVELMQLMASDNITVAREAQMAFASFLAPMIQRSLDQASVVSAIYDDVLIPPGAPQTVPVDPYQFYKEGDYRIWSVTQGGSLHTQGTEGLTEYPFNFYPLNSAISFDKSYVELARLDLITRDIKRLTNEFVSKQERNGWAPILAALAAGVSTNLNGLNNSITAGTAGVFQVDDFNQLKLRHSRIYESYAGGSIAGDYGMTDMFLSPERMADVRSFSYQPMNTRAGSLTTSGATALGLPDSVREKLFDGAGTMEIWGVQLHELKELGINRKLTKIFSPYYQVQNSGSPSPSFTLATQDLILGMDLGAECCKRPVRTDKNGGQLSVKPDNQWVERAEKVGWWVSLTESRIVLDNRFISAIFV